jgi:lysophospholipase L1-like esterase
MKSSKLIGWGRSTLAVAGVVGAALLASCGGGETEQTFTATRVIAFGDETSVINADGSKYTVNALVSGSTATLECASNPIWTQSLASIYGLVFPQCPGSAVDPVSRIRATNGAKVADLTAQIDAQIAEGGFTANDMVTVLVGANDVIEQFAQYPAVGEDQLGANLDAAGAAVAVQVNRIAALGAKVLIATIPDMGRAPYAGDRTAGSTNGNPAVLSRLSKRFNVQLLNGLLNDGHKIGLVQLDAFVVQIDNLVAAGSTAYANTTLAACLPSAPAPTCTTSTLVPAAVGAAWLWADDRHLSATGHNSLATLAVTRAQNNPF